MSVNEVNMAKWIVALRSGTYPQGKGRLRGRDGFCCLGVGCEISGLGNWVEDGKGLPAYRASSDVDRPVLESSAIFPMPVADFFFPAGDYGESANPRLNGASSCTGANDVHGWDFPRIADALETTHLSGKKAEEILAKQP